jgi:hypothetical protein
VRSLIETELINRLSQLSREDLLKLDVEELARVDELLQSARYDKSEERCATDALYWVQNFSATENSHYIEQGVPFIAHFPKKTYFGPLFAAFLAHNRLFIPKTREMITSWSVMAYAAHAAQWLKAEVIVQTAAEEKATRLVQYASILYRNQPEWLRKRHPLTREATLALEWEGGGKVFGIPAGEHKIRMYHPTIYVMDEAAFLPDAQQCYDAANPVAKQIIAISSAGPGWFADQCAR